MPFNHLPKPTRLTPHVLRFTFYASLLLLPLTALLIYRWLFVDLPDPAALYERAAAPSTKIYARHGALLYEIMDPRIGKHSPVPLDEIPAYLRQATIATEDASFYTNPGWDLRGVVRAIYINLRGGEVLSGGSTITQQLARNLLLSPEERSQRTITRKLREIILAYRMTRRYTKDEILALYLNETYYGNLAYGVEAAAQAYYGKAVRELDLAECALLAGLPQAPALYDPLTDPEAARARQAIVLDLMVKHDHITPEEARLAKDEKLHFAAVPFPIKAPHFVMHVHRLLRDEFTLEEVYRRGFNVYTSLDLDMQETAQDIVRYRLAQLGEQKDGEPDHNVHNAALLALDPRTGEVLVMLGSPDYFDATIDGAVNVTLAPRQPGSSIKPITYAAALTPKGAMGLRPYTPATVIMDVRTAFVTREGTPYVPMNYDLQFHGPVLLRDALGSSLNVAAVKVLDEIGIDTMIELARKMGITTFDADERFGLALTLGGGEVRLQELVAAYAAFANGGYKVEPIIITRVEDHAGNVIANYVGQVSIPAVSASAGVTAAVESHPTGERVLSPQVAYLITDILSDDHARLIGFGEGSILNLSRPAAVKTGTTTDWRDNWTVGYTPDLVVGVWVGNVDGSAMHHVTGVTGAAPIWHDFMEMVLNGAPVVEFEEPPGLERVEICADSGLLPTEYCPHRRTEIFIAGTAPRERDTWHQPFKIDLDTGGLATDTCPPARVVERVFTIYPAEAQDWVREQDIPQPPDFYSPRCPPAEPNLPQVSEPAGGLPALEMTSPDEGSVFRLAPNIPPAQQRVRVAARGNDAANFVSVTLYVASDGGEQRALDTFSEPPYSTWWQLAEGAHTFWAVGEDGAGNVVESTQVQIQVR